MKGKHFKMNKASLKVLDTISKISAYIVLIGLFFFIFRLLLKEVIEFSLSTLTAENSYLLIIPMFFAIYVVVKFIRIKSPYSERLEQMEENTIETEKNS